MSIPHRSFLTCLQEAPHLTNLRLPGPMDNSSLVSNLLLGALTYSPSEPHPPLLSKLKDLFLTLHDQPHMGTHLIRMLESRRMNNASSTGMSDGSSIAHLEAVALVFQRVGMRQTEWDRLDALEKSGLFIEMDLSVGRPDYTCGRYVIEDED